MPKTVEHLAELQAIIINSMADAEIFDGNNYGAGASYRRLRGNSKRILALTTQMRKDILTKKKQREKKND